MSNEVCKKTKRKKRKFKNKERTFEYIIVVIVVHCGDNVWIPLSFD